MCHRFSCQLNRQLSHFIALSFLSKMFNRKISTLIYLFRIRIYMIWTSFRYSLSCLFICLPVAVSSILVYVICIERTKPHMHIHKKKLQTCTIYFKSINSQIDCYDCRFFLNLCHSFTFIRYCTIEYVSMYHESNSEQIRFFPPIESAHLYWTKMHSIFVNRPF